jgi:3-deoxy-7-phosphoheptulonate synthase
MKSGEDFICIKCNKEFSDKYKLKQHYGKKIPCNRVLKCDTCNKICNTKQNLERHLNKKKKCNKLESKNILNINQLIAPINILKKLPITDNINKLINKTRRDISNILNNKDDRLIVIVGPCSIHDVKAAYEYAIKLKQMSDNVSNELLIVMRTYFEKPRSTVGWKGLIFDCDLDESFNINKGINLARKLLLDINELQLPVALEFLDTISPQYTSDLVSWGAIGARTVESQLHRELASGLSMPIGFKNGTGGSMNIAIDGCISSNHPHSFLGINEYGISSIISSRGNKDCHLILRGGSNGPNYYEDDINIAIEKLIQKKQLPKVMIDCSHGNSLKDYKNQPIVCEYVGSLIANGNNNIFGVMVESNINEGKQPLEKGKLKFGISITDSCINLETTEVLLNKLAESVKQRRIHNNNIIN